MCLKGIYTQLSNPCVDAGLGGPPHRILKRILHYMYVFVRMKPQEVQYTGTLRGFTHICPCDDEALNSSEYKSFKRNYTELPCPCANTVECRQLLCNVWRMWPYEILLTPGATYNIQILVGMWPHMVLHTGASREFASKLVLVNMRICTKQFSS